MKNLFQVGDLVQLRHNIIADMVKGLKGEVVQVKEETIIVFWENKACLEIAIGKVSKIE